MKKQTLTIVSLLVLPLLVVLIASSPSGVTVFDGQTTTVMSWLQTVPESPWGWCAPVAALMNYVLFALAVVYAVSKKAFCLKGIFWIALAAACVAAIPIVVQSDLKIVPNVFGVILLCAQSIAARMAQKNGADENEKNPKSARLNRR